MGPYAHAFLDWMTQAGLSVWQVLPLHPVGAGHSPYASPSAFAGDWRLISVEELVRVGLLEAVSLPWGTDRLDFQSIDLWKRPLIERAARAVSETAACRAWAVTQRDWLEDWALYNALRAGTGAGWQSFGGARPGKVLRRDYAEQIAVESGVQFLFATQWQALREDAAKRGIRVLGDIPLFVSGDGVDVWCHPELFRSSGEGDVKVADPVAGVPPDYFSPDGQRWGNPTYDWDAHARSGYAWWTARVRHELDLVDELRIDHFRGLVANWAIPAHETDARKGVWTPGPGRALFDAVEAALPGTLERIIAEDLGDITPQVAALRDQLRLPGMKILQFGFGDSSDGTPWTTNPFLPHMFDGSNWIAYTGTHDNDTALGWYLAADPVVQDRFRRYTARDGSDAVWALLREVWASVADTAITPMQDVLGLDNDARMNIPGAPTGSWSWRLRELPWHRCTMVRGLGETYGR